MNLNNHGIDLSFDGDRTRSLVRTASDARAIAGTLGSGGGCEKSASEKQPFESTVSDFEGCMADIIVHDHAQTMSLARCGVSPKLHALNVEVGAHDASWASCHSGAEKTFRFRSVRGFGIGFASSSLVTDTSFEIGAEMSSTAWEPRAAGDLRSQLTRLEFDAWEALYLAHRQLIRGVLAGCLDDTTDLETVVLNVVLAALELVAAGNADVPADDSRVRAWLVSIALGIACKQEKRGPGRTFESSETSQPEDELPLRQMHRVLSQLPLRLRIPWVLHHLEKMSPGEIASCIGISAARTTRRLHRADLRFFQLAEQTPLLKRLR